MYSDHITEFKNVTGVYCIKCTVANRIYVGSAMNLRERYMEHARRLRGNRHDNKRVQHAYNKYGNEAFSFHVLEVCQPAVLIAREQHYMDTLGAVDRDKGFNLKPKARNMAGFSHSDETKKHLSASLKGRTMSEEHRSKLSEATKSFYLNNPDKMEQLRASRAAKGYGAETRARMSANRKGKTPRGKVGVPRSQETKMKISATKKRNNLIKKNLEFNVRQYVDNDFTPDAFHILEG